MVQLTLQSSLWNQPEATALLNLVPLSHPALNESCGTESLPQALHPGNLTQDPVLLYLWLCCLSVS